MSADERRWVNTVILAIELLQSRCNGNSPCNGSATALTQDQADQMRLHAKALGGELLQIPQDVDEDDIDYIDEA